MSGQYTCDSCDKTFDKNWSDEDAASEYAAMAPQLREGNAARGIAASDVVLEDPATVCHDCFKKMVAYFGWSVPA